MGISADEAYNLLPDQLYDGMPPEVESLVVFKGDKDMFDQQFSEIEGYDGLDKVASYIDQNQLSELNSNLDQCTETDLQTSLVNTNRFSVMVP